MQHTIPVDQLGPQGPAMATAVNNCVHCGFCLPTCPTYLTLGIEMDSPRGRIVLMKETLEGTLPLAESIEFIDRCLGCQACVTACPSGVQYGELLSSFREWASDRRPQSLIDRATSTLVQQTLPYPDRFRAAATTGRLAQPLKGLLPQKMGVMLDLLPPQLPAEPPYPEVYPARGPRRARVALLTGCVQRALNPDINGATLRVLAANGVETVIPRGQGCCGSLSLHTGHAGHARQMARHNIARFPHDIDAIIINAAGCGSGIKEYGLLFAGLPDQAEAAEYARLTRDISQFLIELGPITPPPLPKPRNLAYHDACHLAHAQGIRRPPRDLLRLIPNLTLLEIPESELCCGSAGAYNIDQPAIAHDLGVRKAQHILTVEPDGVVMGNIGCMIQIEKHLRLQGRTLPVYHTIQVLDQAYAAA